MAWLWEMGEEGLEPGLRILHPSLTSARLCFPLRLVSPSRGQELRRAPTRLYPHHPLLVHEDRGCLPHRWEDQK